MTDAAVIPAPEPAPGIPAVEIARALSLREPTEQQRAVIEAPLAPSLVIAGAGSGKTETMAARVLWLLANRHVRQDQVLGLTFTRKAAGELGQRIRERIHALVAAGLLDDDHDPLDAPTVSTYNAFASALARDHSVLIGREPDGVVMGAAAAWQAVRRIVVADRDLALAELNLSPDRLADAALQLEHEIAENVADPERVADLGRRFARLVELPLGGRGSYDSVLGAVAKVGALPALVGIGERYRAWKTDRGLVEFSDQVADALRIVRTAPEVVAELRDRHRVVLLDEYQDTSTVQTALLSELFRGLAVTAVGDPNQSIYGWRGASAANLAQFPWRFGAQGAGAAPVARFSLSVSWRNGDRILDAADALVAPLSIDSGVPVERLTSGPAATAHPIDSVFAETVDDEAGAVAAWLAARLETPDSSAALLLRTRATQPVFLAALAARGVHYHVLGIDGLLAEPEVADLVAALSVLVDPSAGSSLVRLLAGSRWRLGVRDLGALADAARWLGRRDLGQRALPDEVRERFRSSASADEGSSIVDALDVVADARDGHPVTEGFSAEGLARVREAGLLFRGLRARAGLDLLDLVQLVSEELLLDVEVAANPFRPRQGAAMEAFTDALTGYLEVDPGAQLPGFLRWLRDAERRENLSPRPEEPEPGTVQVLTVHGSKGLEWDAVAVPRLVADEFPAKQRDGAGWLALGALPYPLRGDAADLPELDWAEATTRKELSDLIGRGGEYRAEVADRSAREERRLAYVAVTRARHRLMLSGSFWAAQREPRAPGPFLVELADAGLIASLPEGPECDENPRAADDRALVWPSDPLGGRREAVERAAAAVRGADAAASTRFDRELDLLLAERDELARGAAVALPTRVPASRFKDFVADPRAVADALRRPMPERPYRATRLGTLFHSWVEQRAGGGGPSLDALTGELDLDVGPEAGPDPAAAHADAGADPVAEADRLGELIATFEGSEWADRLPIEVEREIHLPFDGRVVICKIDAVYAGRGDRVQIVDWKTGKAPSGEADLAERRLQLALYRLAYARWSGRPLDTIDAAFYFVSDDVTIPAPDVLDEDQLLALWRASVG